MYFTICVNLPTKKLLGHFCVNVGLSDDLVGSLVILGSESRVSGSIGSVQWETLPSELADNRNWIKSGSWDAQDHGS